MQPQKSNNKHEQHFKFFEEAYYMSISNTHATISLIVTRCVDFANLPMLLVYQVATGMSPTTC
jgi:hypothetical protein